MIKNKNIEGEELLREIKKTIPVLNTYFSNFQSWDMYLFLLCCYKEGYITKGLNSSHGDTINKRIFNSLQQKCSFKGIFHEILPIFKFWITNANNDAMSILYHTLLKLNRIKLKNNFPYVFESAIHLFYQQTGRQDSLYNDSVLHLLETILSPKENDKILNIYAISASLGIWHPADNTNYYGYDTNRLSWAIGKLRLNVHQKDCSTYYNLDPMSNWPVNSEDFDLIISHTNEKNGIEIINKWQEANGSKTKLAIILPDNFLYSSVFFKNRRQLVESKENIKLKYIISLKTNSTNSPSNSYSIIVCDKAYSDNSNIFFLKGNSIMEMDSVSSIDEFVKSSRSKTNILRKVSLDEIRDNEYNLNIPRYFIDEVSNLKNKNMVPLSTILSLLKGNIRDVYHNYVSVANLKNDKRDYTLHLKDLESIPLDIGLKKEINESCLLVSLILNTYKPTYYHYKNQSIFISNHIAAFKVNTDKVDIDYLINELHKDYIKDQLDSYRTGANIQYLRPKDLLKISIKLPDIDEQKAIVKEAHENLIEIEEIKEETDAKIKEIWEKQYEEAASLIHSLGTPRLNILSWVQLLIDFLGKDETAIAQFNNLFKEMYENTSPLDALNEIKSDLGLISDIIERGQNGLIIKKHPLVFMSINSISSLINNLSAKNYNFSIKTNHIGGDTEAYNERGIYANQTLLKILLENVLSNANKHGFPENEIGNEVRIELSEKNNLLIIDIKNNGKKFSENFTQQNFIEKYKTTKIGKGTGIGGYDIHRIAEHLGDRDWELVLNEENSLYPVRFRFRFPIIFKE